MYQYIDQRLFNLFCLALTLGLSHTSIYIRLVASDIFGRGLNNLRITIIPMNAVLKDGHGYFILHEFCIIGTVTAIYGYDTDVAGYWRRDAFAEASATTACGQSTVTLPHTGAYG